MHMEKVIMENLTIEEMSECNGGIGLAAITLAFTIISACVTAGYTYGKDCAERDRRRHK